MKDENQISEEYKRIMEKADQAALERESERVYYADISDLACLILEAVREAAEGLPREKIVEQLPRFPADYIEHAFRMAIGDGSIESVPHTSCMEWYRLGPGRDFGE